MKTGLFKENSSQDYVLLLEGKEIARYASVKEFVDEHAELLEKLKTSSWKVIIECPVSFLGFFNADGDCRSFNR